MRAARFVEANKDLELMEIPKPIPTDGQALISVKAVGICGSDVHIQQGHTPVAYTPITIGHEMAGIVEEINGDSLGINVGDHVFVNPMVGCGDCEFCFRGEFNYCPSRSVLGIQSEGALADYVVAPTAALTVMPKTLGFPEIALVESAGTANNAVRTLGVAAGDLIVVIGVGGLGMQAARIAIAKGARVAAIDSDPIARDRALKAGVEYVFEPNEENTVEKILATVGAPKGVSAVVDCVGIQPTINTGLNLLKMNGHLAIVGIGGAPLTLTPPAHFMRRALRVSGIYGYSALDIQQVCDRLIDGSLDLKASVSVTLPLERVNEGISMFANRENSPVRVVIEP